MGRFFYFLIVLILVRLAWSAASAWLTATARRQMGGGRARTAPDGHGMVNKGLMVRDPVCGLHLPESSAISLERSGQTVHFCSEECRARFVEAT